MMILLRRREVQQNWKSGAALFAQLTPDDGWRSGAALLVQLTTDAVWQSGQGLSTQLQTAEVPLPQLPQLPALPSGDVVHQPPRAYLVTHSGLPTPTISYTLGNARGNGDARDKLTASIELAGKVDAPSGELFITVQVAPLTGADAYAQVYGPFKVLGSNQTRTPTGWKTSLSTADTTIADAEAQQGWRALAAEYLPWEIERDLTPYQAALAQQTEAARQQALKDVPCKAASAPDRRSVTVQSLIYWLIEQLGLPTTVTAPLPYVGDRFWASESTGVMIGQGMLLGTSYQVKGKKAIDVLRDLLGRIGWTVKLGYGQVIIGPPAPLSTGAPESAGELGLPADLLTETKIEYINATPGGGDFSTPSSVKMQGARIRNWLQPLADAAGNKPGQTPEASFETSKDAVYKNGPTTVYATDAQGYYRLDSTTITHKTKTDGLVRSDDSQTDGMVKVRDGSTNKDGSPHLVDMWASPREKRETVYTYADPRFPGALTRQAETVSAFAEPVGYLVSPSETTITAKSWHAQGWLQRRETTKRHIGEWDIRTTTITDVVTETTTTTMPLWITEVEIETWLPTRPGWWHHRVTRTTEDYWLIKEDGEPSTLLPRRKTEVLIDEETDQGPELAPTPDAADKAVCPADQPDGIAYDDPIEMVYQAGGRGDPVTVDIPWASSLPEAYPRSYLASLGQQPAKRTTYTMPAPPRIRLGSVVKSFSLSGNAATVSATVTIEEKL